MLSFSVTTCACSVVPVLSVSKFVVVSVVGFFDNSAGKVKIESGHWNAFIDIIDSALWMLKEKKRTSPIRSTAFKTFDKTSWLLFDIIPCSHKVLINIVHVINVFGHWTNYILCLITSNMNSLFLHQDDVNLTVEICLISICNWNCLKKNMLINIFLHLGAIRGFYALNASATEIGFQGKFWPGDDYLQSYWQIFMGQ